MIHYEVLEAEYVPLATVKKVLGKRKKDELSYEQSMALDNAKNYSRITESSAKKLIKALKELDMRKLKDEFIVKIADLIPSTKEELILILNTSKISFKEDEVNQILDVVKQHAK